jgi:hypothetical protein
MGTDGGTTAIGKTAEPLRSLLERSPRLRRMLRGAEEQRIQIVLGLLEPGADGEPILRQSGYRPGAEYFYPASSIKFFAAIAALEKLAEIRREAGYPLTRDTPMALYPLFEGEKLERGDDSHRATGTITVGHEIRKLAVVSDNEAFNRLYEMVGQDGIAASLDRAGIRSARIVHRLDEFRSAEENRHYPRTDFLGDTFQHTIPERVSPPLEPPPRSLPKLLVGNSYYSGDVKVDRPMDFSAKNRIDLVDLQRGLCKLVHPEADCGGGPAFALDEEDRAFLLEAMTFLPRQCPDPHFDPAEYPDDYVKNLLPGLLEVLPLERWRIVNKTGEAYGFSIENAYVEDRVSGRAVFIAATIYANADGTLNDDQYEYSTVAKPFFAELGRAVGGMLRAPAGAP